MNDANEPERPIVNVVLMGLRGSGKSTLGRSLALALDSTFIDLDDMTVMRLGGNSVTEVWKQGGETGFREAETAALRAVLGNGDRAGASGGKVIALGGGTPTAPGAGTLLKAAAAAGDVTVYLRATPATLRQRLEESDIGDRPSLTGGDGQDAMLEEIEAVFDQRDALYRDLAMHVVDVDGMAEPAVVERLCKIIPSLE